MIPELRDGIIIANHARNTSYPLAEAANDAGYLRKFVTGVYHKPSTPFGRVLEALAGRVGEKDLGRLRGRRNERLPDDKVASVPLPELVEEGVGRALARHGRDRRAAVYLKCEAFDWIVSRRHVEPCTIFHGFEQCALFSLRRARSLGATTVLDQQIIHRTELDRIEREERARLGVPAPTERPFWFQQHVDRKYAEHEVTDYVFAGLDMVKRTMVKNGFAADRVFVIPYGTDVRVQPSFDRPSRDRPSRDRPSRDRLEVLYVGPVHYWKGLPYLLEIMAMLEVPARLTIVGRTEPDWAAYFAPRMAALGERCRYLGPVPSGEMPKVYADADVLVFPGPTGGIGLVCYEAMAMGLPVITADGDVVIRHEVDGLSVPFGDLEGWKQALTGLAQSPERRRTLGAAGAERVKAFSWEAYRRGVVDAYETIWERERGARAGAARRAKAS
jgi:glycosyltransferase involved in cell wall biosynthesis